MIDWILTSLLSLRYNNILRTPSGGLSVNVFSKDSKNYYFFCVKLSVIKKNQITPFKYFGAEIFWKSEEKT